MNIAQFLFKRSSLEGEYAKEGELPGSDSNEDTSNWVARVGRKKAAGEEEATQHTRKNKTQTEKHNEEHNTQGGHLILGKKAAAEEEGIQCIQYTSSAVLSIFMFEH